MTEEPLDMQLRLQRAQTDANYFGQLSERYRKLLIKATDALDQNRRVLDEIMIELHGE